MNIWTENEVDWKAAGPIDFEKIPLLTSSSRDLGIKKKSLSEVTDGVRGFFSVVDSNKIDVECIFKKNSRNFEDPQSCINFFLLVVILIWRGGKSLA